MRASEFENLLLYLLCMHSPREMEMTTWNQAKWSVIIPVKWRSVGTLEDGDRRNACGAEFTRRCIEPQRRVAIEARAGFTKGHNTPTH